MAGARLALAQYEPPATMLSPSNKDQASAPLLSTSLKVINCSTCKDKSSTKDVYTTSAIVTNTVSSALLPVASSNLSSSQSATPSLSICSICSDEYLGSAVSSSPSATTDPPTPISLYMLYTSPPTPSSDESSNNPISFYMIYTPPSSANASSVGKYNASMTGTLPSNHSQSTVCPSLNLTTRTSWTTAPAITVTSVVTETWHRIVNSCNNTSTVPNTTKTLTANITVTVEKTIMRTQCNNISSALSIASPGYTAQHNSTGLGISLTSQESSTLAPINSNSTLQHSLSSTVLSSSAYIISLSTITPTASLTAPSLATSSVNGIIGTVSSSTPAYPMPTPSGMLECADGSYAKSAQYCPGGLMYPPSSPGPAIDWPAFTPSKVRWGPNATSTVKVYKREEGDGVVEPTADTNEPAGEPLVLNVHATMFRRWRTHHYH
ncbi:MAG: hypothetical protein M1812_006094 [Candelaria pacifica]|nr:MAG: hypothetical protein M1812_006094 [Candelaria pacifica]